MLKSFFTNLVCKNNIIYSDGITKHMAVEWGGNKHVRVNGVAPGPIGGTVGMNKLGWLFWM